MNFYEDIVSQHIKTGFGVCGDYTVCLRKPGSTVNILCDGIGSGVYANIAARYSASRFTEHIMQGVQLQESCEMVAASMHRARTQDIPYVAFSVAEVTDEGHFTVYNYDAPEPVIWQNGQAAVLKPRVYTTGYELLGVSQGRLNKSDALLTFSDGVSQAGLGRGYGFGIGSAGVADFLNKSAYHGDARSLPKMLTEYVSGICENRHDDDTTLSMMLCRDASEITILTGPPSRLTLDKECVAAFMESPGKKVICGSTTTDIVSRVLDKPVQMNKATAFGGGPPEYFIEGIDLTAEGAVMLNQACNIIDEPPENLTGETVVERFCEMLHEADVVRIIIGNAVNNAHESMFFKQVGIKVRRTAVNTLKEKLTDMGKLVLERSF